MVGAVVVAVAVAAVVDGADVIARWLSFDAVVVAVGTVVACYPAFGDVWLVVVAVGDLRLLWLCFRDRIAVSYSCSFGLFFCLVAVANRFNFGGFGLFGRCSGN